MIDAPWSTIARGVRRYLPTTRLHSWHRQVGEEETPRWLFSPDSLTISRVAEDEYTGVIGTTSFDINPPAECRELEIPLVAPGYCIGVRVRDADHRFEQRIECDASFDYPHAIWRTLDISSYSGDGPLRIEVEWVKDSSRTSSLESWVARTFSRDRSPPSPDIGLPSIVPTEEQPPILLISLDSVTYEVRDQLEPLLDALGPDVIVPAEPRVQSNWTAPSHASMITGTRPGKHGYVAQGNDRPINPDLTTLPELLTDHGYKCSALVSHTRILPEVGFGRGFHRFRHGGMVHADWVTRDNDARASVDDVIEWIETDCKTRDHSLFYFLHLFDPHYPYIPPLDTLESDIVDLGAPSRFTDQWHDTFGDYTYLDVLDRDHDIDPTLVSQMEDWYEQSIAYTAEQVARLVRSLQTHDLFDRSLIIVTGDHGEEFGERGFITHKTLYDKTVRPFMAIKPPASADWPTVDAVDTVDFLPTIADLVGADVPPYCDGTAIQKGVDDGRLRVAERFYPDWYSIAVESGGQKGIFTYESNHPDRPDAQMLDEGPVREEFYRLEAVRSGDYDEASPDTETRDRLRNAALEAIRQDADIYTAERHAAEISQETEAQLADLGYK